MTGLDAFVGRACFYWLMPVCAHLKLVCVGPDKKKGFVSQYAGVLVYESQLIPETAWSSRIRKKTDLQKSH